MKSNDLAIWNWINSNWNRNGLEMSVTSSLLSHIYLFDSISSFRRQTSTEYAQEVPRVCAIAQWVGREKKIIFFFFLVSAISMWNAFARIRTWNTNTLCDCENHIFVAVLYLFGQHVLSVAHMCFVFDSVSRFAILIFFFCFSEFSVAKISSRQMCSAAHKNVIRRYGTLIVSFFFFFFIILQTKAAAATAAPFVFVSCNLHEQVLLLPRYLPIFSHYRLSLSVSDGLVSFTLHSICAYAQRYTAFSYTNTLQRKNVDAQHIRWANIWRLCQCVKRNVKTFCRRELMHIAWHLMH